MLVTDGGVDWCHQHQIFIIKAAVTTSNFNTAVNLAKKYNYDKLESVFGNLLKDSFASDFGNDDKINVFESLFVT